MEAETGGAVPFCGLPPLPGEAGWSTEPSLLLVLALGAVLLWRAGGMRAASLSGWVLVGAALASPLCQLAVSLFSVRVAQHMLMLLGAAPLLALGLPAGRRAPSGGALAAATAAFAVALWLWHLPGPYGWTFRSDLAWWAMHASLLGTATWLWRGLLSSAPARAEASLLCGLATAAQMGALGAFLTFAPRPLFAPHALTTLPWGLTPLEDQQLGGLLMWVPGGIAFAVLALLSLSRALGTVPDRLKA